MLSKVPIRVRDWKFESGKNVPKYWHPGGKALTRYFDNLSLFFPAGERFFIQAVKAHAHLVTDPALRKEVDEFIAQEAMHNREHIRYNERLMTETPVMRRLEKRTRNILALVKRFTRPRDQLTITAALEHFTALMGHSVLNDARLLDGAHPEMAALWRWHSAEETEHKGVAYDVAMAAGVTQRERIVWMTLTTLVFWVLVVDQQLRIMNADGLLFDRAEWKKMLRFLFKEPGGMGGLFVAALEFNRQNFHPWQLDNGALLEQL